MKESADAGLRRIRARYLRLGTGELVAAVVFTVVGAVQVAPRLPETALPAWWAALVPLVFILAQAGGYWLAARAWVGRGSMPKPLARLFAVMGVLDMVLLLIGMVVLLVAPPASWALVACAAVWMFGVIEFLNYFVVRVAYPPRSWWSGVRRRRAPRLMRDVRGALGA